MIDLANALEGNLRRERILPISPDCFVIGIAMGVGKDGEEFGNYGVVVEKKRDHTGVEYLELHTLSEKEIPRNLPDRFKSQPHIR